MSKLAERNARIGRVALTEIANISADIFNDEERVHYRTTGAYTQKAFEKMKKIASEALARMNEKL